MSFDQNVGEKMMIEALKLFIRETGLKEIDHRTIDKGTCGHSSSLDSSTSAEVLVARSQKIVGARFEPGKQSKFPNYFLALIKNNRMFSWTLIKRQGVDATLNNRQTNQELDSETLAGSMIETTDKALLQNSHKKDLIAIIPILLLCLTLIGMQGWELHTSLLFGGLVLGLALSGINYYDTLTQSILTGKKVIFAEIIFTCYVSLSLYSLLFPLDLSLVVLLAVLFFIAVYNGVNLFVSNEKPNVYEMTLTLLTLILSFGSILAIDFTFSWIACLQMLLIAFLVFFSIRKFSEVYSQQHEQMREDSKIRAFKRDPQNFSAIMKVAPTAESTEINVKEIVLGNTNAATQLTILTNPNDSTCALTMSHVKTLLAEHGEEVKVILRFKMNSAESDSSSFIICSRVLELYEQYGEKITLEAYALWLKKQDLKTWLELYDAPHLDSSKILNVLNEHHIWAVKNKFKSTPVIVLNDKVIPEIYNCSDLMATLPYILSKKEG